MSMNTKQMEIETIAKRKIELNLSDAVYKRIYDKAGEAGLTVPEFIGNVIEDLFDSTEKSFAQNPFFNLKREENDSLNESIDFAAVEKEGDQSTNITTDNHQLDLLRGLSNKVCNILFTVIGWEIGKWLFF